MNIDNLTESVKNNKMLLIFSLVIVVIIVNLVIIYKKAHQNQLIIVDKPTLVNDIAKHISYDKLPISTSKVQCAYSVWIYINDRPGNAKRTYGDNHFYRVFSKDVDDIINHSGKTKYSCLKNNSRGDKEQPDNYQNMGSPGLYYRPSDGKLMITATTSKLHKFITKSIPLQKWNNILLSIDDNHIDVYINSELHRSYKLDSVINLGNGHLKLSESDNNLYGMISYFRYFNHSLTPAQVNNLYYHTNLDSPEPPYLWWLITP